MLQIYNLECNKINVFIFHLHANDFKQDIIIIRKVIYMSNTTPVYARIDSELKENAEMILNQL